MASICAENCLRPTLGECPLTPCSPSSRSRRRCLCAWGRTSGTPRPWDGWLSRRCELPMGHMASGSCPTRRIRRRYREATRPPVSRPLRPLGSSWDVDLLRRVGEALGRECREEHVARASWAGGQHQALTIVRSELRVPVGGSRAVRCAGDGVRAGGAERGRGRLGEALCGRTIRRPTGTGQRRRRRADAAGDLSSGVRAGGEGCETLDGHVRLQPSQRHPRVAASVAAHRGAAR